MSGLSHIKISLPIGFHPNLKIHFKNYLHQYFNSTMNVAKTKYKNTNDNTHYDDKLSDEQNI